MKFSLILSDIVETLFNYVQKYWKRCEIPESEFDELSSDIDCIQRELIFAGYDRYILDSSKVLDKFQYVEENFKKYITPLMTKIEDSLSNSKEVAIGDLIQEKDKVAIIGKPGCGKTEFLNCLLENNPNLISIDEFWQFSREMSFTKYEKLKEFIATDSDNTIVCSAPVISDISIFNKIFYLYSNSDQRKNHIYNRLVSHNNCHCFDDNLRVNFFPYFEVIEDFIYFPQVLDATHIVQSRPNVCDKSTKVYVPETVISKILN